MASSIPGAAGELQGAGRGLARSEESWETPVDHEGPIGKQQLIMNDLKVFKLDKVESYDVDLSPQVVRALSIVDTLLSKSDRRAQCIEVFKSLATQFISDITDEELHNVIHDYVLSRGVVCVVDSIYVGKLSTGVMLETDLVEASDGHGKVPHIYFDAFLASHDRGERQLYLHLVKILHELCHVLTPGLIRLSLIKRPSVGCGISAIASPTTPADLKKLPPRFATPETIGPICSGRGDSGSGFEDAALGGRVLLDADNMKAPFAHELRLKTLPYPQFPPTMAGNDSLRIIPDKYVTDIVAQWTAWQEKGGKIPSLAIPFSGFVLLRHAQFPSLEAAQQHYNKKRKSVPEPAPAERTSKRYKKSHTEGEEQEAASQSSEEDSCDIHRYMMGANEDDEDLELEQEGSVITGGIGAHQLEEMKRRPFLRF